MTSSTANSWRLDIFIKGTMSRQHGTGSISVEPPIVLEDGVTPPRRSSGIRWQPPEVLLPPGNSVESQEFVANVNHSSWLHSFAASESLETPGGGNDQQEPLINFDVDDRDVPTPKPTSAPTQPPPTFVQPAFDGQLAQDLNKLTDAEYEIFLGTLAKLEHEVPNASQEERPPGWSSGSVKVDFVLVQLSTAIQPMLPAPLPAAVPPPIFDFSNVQGSINPRHDEAIADTAYGCLEDQYHIEAVGNAWNDNSGALSSRTYSPLNLRPSPPPDANEIPVHILRDLTNLELKALLQKRIESALAITRYMKVFAMNDEHVSSATTRVQVVDPDVLKRVKFRQESLGYPPTNSSLLKVSVEATLQYMEGRALPLDLLSVEERKKHELIQSVLRLNGNTHLVLVAKENQLPEMALLVPIEKVDRVFDLIGLEQPAVAGLSM